MRILNFIEIVYYFSIKEFVVRSKFTPVFFFLFVFFGITIEIVLNKKVFNDFKIYLSSLKIWYLKGYKWFK